LVIITILYIFSGKAPEFKVKPESVNVKENCEVKVTATIEGTPEPSVEWQKDGKILDNNSRVSISNVGGKYTFVISKTSMEDSAEYTIVATNETGTEKASFKIVVSGNFCVLSTNILVKHFQLENKI
jgi:hypothetical protein